MIYLWNILMWCWQMIPPVLRRSRIIAWVKVHVYPIMVLHTEFLLYRAAMIKKLHINGQTVVMENLLNDIFDPTDRRITITTAFDIVDTFYISQPGAEFATSPVWLGQPGETPQLYVGQPEEYGVITDFIVQAASGSLNSDQEAQLKYIVYKYKLASKRALFQYDDLTTF